MKKVFSSSVCILFCVVLIFAAACTGGIDYPGLPSTTVADPVFSPASGTYSQAQTVSISTTTSGAQIRYTTDGSTPTRTTGTLYSAPVNVSTSMTIKAIAYTTMYQSNVSTSSYTINTGGGDTGGETDAQWTVMIYINADNNLSSAGADDLSEMEAVDLNGSKINVIVLIDQSSNGDTKLYKVGYGSSTRLSSTELGISATGNDELDMGDYNTLSKFIDFGKINYKAKKYAVIIWNHGSGWRSSSGNGSPAGYKAVSSDDTNGNIMYNHEMAQAVAGKGLTIIGFDACLMGMLETAYEIRNHAQYMIGSEDNEPGDGWDYTAWLNAFKNSAKTPVDFINAVVNAYAAQYSSTSKTTLAGVDLTKIDNIMEKLNAFSTKLRNTITNNTIRDEIKNLILNYVEDYKPESYFSVSGDHNIDLYDLAHQIETRTDYADAEAAALKAAVSQAVIKEWHNADGNPRSNGLSVHFVHFSSSYYSTSYNHDEAYSNTYSGEHPVSFVYNSTWANNPGTGLLHKLWYE